ncbi:hypothetical protein G6L37_07520 [Agrobacterium rubi]|nr:hypothetical protein [Agrobacterium rubi]NTF25217.1 hypothetical protein [Agrobacterium rubi]
MTTKEFDLEAHMKDFGRIDFSKPVHMLSDLTLLPGRAPAKALAYDPHKNIIYMQDLVSPILASHLPDDAFPLLVGPAFKWTRKADAWKISDAIRNARVVYDETTLSESTPADRYWARMHAAYVLNEMAPDQIISVRLFEEVEGASGQNEEPRYETNASRGTSHNARPPKPETEYVLSQLLDCDDEDEEGSFEFGDDNPFDEGRQLTCREWYAEQLQIGRQHFSFMTNFKKLGIDIIKHYGVTAVEASEIMGMFHHGVHDEIRDAVLAGHKSPDIGHPIVLQILFGIAESTQLQRLALYDQLVSARKPEDVTLTLGARIVSGHHFGTKPHRMRKIQRGLQAIALLLGAGLIRLDGDRRSIEVTEDGLNTVEALGSGPHINGYQERINDQIGFHEDPNVVGPEVEAWIMEYFTNLKRVKESLAGPVT